MPGFALAAATSSLTERMPFDGAKLNDAQKQMILSETAQKVFRMRTDAWTRS